MTSPSNSDVQNLLPVQAYFGTDGSFQTFIGQGRPFYASISPIQTGLTITDSTINSTTIGAVVPSTGAFTNISTTTGTITTPPSGANDIVNYLALQSYAVGISWKAPVTAATTANITLSGTQTVDGVTLAVGDTVLVKNQSTASQNGIYTVNAGAWTYATGCTDWEQYVSALVFVEYGGLAGSAWYCAAQPGGTLGTTSMTWSNFSTAASYTAGTGLTLSGYQFSITPVGTAGTYGSASSVPVITTNASGQVSSVTNTSIAISNAQVSGLGTMSTQNANSVAITGGTIDGATIGGSTAGAVTGTTITANTQFTGAGTGLTGTAAALSIGGNAATATSATSATSATTATNLAGGSAGSLPYQASSGSTTLLAAGTNGQVLTLASGVPSWATPTAGTVTSVGGTGTVSGISLSGTVTSSGNLTLGGSLDLSSPPAIGGTTAAAITGTTVTANTKFVGPYFDAATSAGGALRNASGTAQIQWGGGGGNNVTVDVSANLNGTNAQIDISPTGTGHVHIKPSGAGSLEIAPTSAGTIDNMAIGGTTAAAGSFTTLAASSTISANGSVGTSGQVLTSAGAGSPATWSTLGYATITDDTTTNATRYPLFAAATTGNLTTEYTSSTKFQFNPSTGYMTVTGLTSPIINNPTITNYTESVVAIGNSSTAQTLSLTNGTVQTVTMTGNCTFTMPTATAGKSFILIANTGAGSFTATFTSVKWPNNTAPTLTTTASNWDIFTFVSDGTNWYGNSAQAYA